MFAPRPALLQQVLQIFKPVLESHNILKVWHNYSFDRHVLHNHGLDVQGLGGDTMHMARLFDTAREKAGGYSLEALTTDYLQKKKVSMKELFARPKPKKVRAEEGGMACQGALPSSLAVVMHATLTA